MTWIVIFWLVANGLWLIARSHYKAEGEAAKAAYVVGGVISINMAYMTYLFGSLLS